MPTSLTHYMPAGSCKKPNSGARESGRTAGRYVMLPVIRLLHALSELSAQSYLLHALSRAGAGSCL